MLHFCLVYYMNTRMRKGNGSGLMEMKTGNLTIHNMAKNFAAIAFSDTVKEMQEKLGSRCNLCQVGKGYLH